jgi:hypothetical protein
MEFYAAMKKSLPFFFLSFLPFLSLSGSFSIYFFLPSTFLPSSLYPEFIEYDRRFNLMKI